MQSGGGAVAKGMKKECVRTDVFCQNHRILHINIDRVIFVPPDVPRHVPRHVPNFVPPRLFFVTTFCSTPPVFRYNILFRAA